jgi:hypothetical protein
MQLSFTVLLASLIAVLISPDAFVDAAPIKRDTGMVSLPIKRLQARSGVHPLVVSGCASPQSPFTKCIFRCTSSTLTAPTGDSLA